MTELLTRIILCSSEESFKRLSNSAIREMYLIGYKQPNGFIFVVKNRFNGKTGTYTKEGWDKLRDQTIALNYSATLKSAMEDVKKFRENRKKK